MIAMELTPGKAAPKSGSIERVLSASLPGLWAGTDCDSAVIVDAEGQVNRHASTAGCNVITKVLEFEPGKRHVTVKAMTQAATNTELFKSSPASRRALTDASSPLGQIGEAGELADVIAWLVTDESRWAVYQQLIASIRARL